MIHCLRITVGLKNTTASSGQSYSLQIFISFFIINYLGGDKMSILQDKVQKNLIKINRLQAENEEIKYIVPLFYNAIKDIYNNTSLLKIETGLVEQINQKFKHFHEQYQIEMATLEQVHMYMIQECFEMLQSRQTMSKSEIKKSQIQSKSLVLIQQEATEDDVIILSQQTYQFQSQPESSIIEQKGATNSKVRRPLSLDDVPQSLKSGLDTHLQWNYLQKLYQQHRIDEAVNQCEKFQNSLFLSDPNSKINQQNYDLIQKIHQQEQLMKHYYEFFNQTGYTLDKTQNGVSMYYKIQEAKKEVAVRIEAELDISIDRFLCIATEIDLMQDFVPFAYDTKEIKRISRNKKIGLTRVYVPIFSNRQAYFYAAAYDRLNTTKSIFCYSKTITSDVEFQKKLNIKIEKDPQLVELQYKFCILEYEPITLNRGKIRLATNIDMKLTFLPLFIINKSLRIFSFDFFINLMEVNSKFQGSAWQKKMQLRPQLYEFFKERIKQYLEEQADF